MATHSAEPAHDEAHAHAPSPHSTDAIEGDDLPHHGAALAEPRSPAWLPLLGIALLAVVLVWWLSTPSDAEVRAAEAAASASAAAAAASASEAAPPTNVVASAQQLQPAPPRPVPTPIPNAPPNPANTPTFVPAPKAMNAPVH
jgi:hypothetical protein